MNIAFIRIKPHLFISDPDKKYIKCLIALQTSKQT